jgi:hypothetical protein
MDKKIAFLFGSGISIPGGFPTTSDITLRILSGENIIRHTDGTYYFTEDNIDDLHKFDYSVARVCLFLKRLLLEIDHYYLFDFINHYTNYEELYYVINQMHDSELGEFENPVIGAFIEKISIDLVKICHIFSSEASQPWEFSELFGEAENYIRDVVWRMLLHEPSHFEYLKNICDACLDDEFQNVDIFTLNHDFLIETALNNFNITYNLGFGNPVNDVCYWHPKLLESFDTKVRLLKLHGSINWFQFPQNEYSFGPVSVGIPTDWDIWHTHNPFGEMQTPAGGRPLFLAGTFNKMLHYTHDIFADLYYHFRRSLKTIDHLIICGYGFADKGINSQIVEWMYQSTKKHIIIIHKEPGGLKMHARGAIKKNWDGWTNNGQFCVIESFIEDISWQEIKSCL